MFGPGGREASRARPRTVGVVACPAPWGVLWVSPQPLRVVIPCGRVTLSGRGCRFLGEGGALSVEATRGVVPAADAARTPGVLGVPHVPDGVESGGSELVRSVRFVSV